MKISLIFSLHFLPACILSISSFKFADVISCGHNRRIIGLSSGMIDGNFYLGFDNLESFLLVLGLVIGTIW